MKTRAQLLPEEIKADNDGMVLDPRYADEIEDAHRAVDWGALAAAGYDKTGDYCFIYSYPPVRTLQPIPSTQMFEPSPWEPHAETINMYLHIPYCSGICSYCYFAKVVDTGRGPVPKAQYIPLLIWEIEDKLQRYGGDPEIQTIHFGGGTPSILEIDQIEQIMSYLSSLNLSLDAEITFECAPETIYRNLDKLKVLRDNGVNRINVGVENLDDRVLKLMARRHGSDVTIGAIENVRRVGFDNVNVDLIYALPGQSLASWVETLKTVCSWGLESVSVYRLRKHPMKRISKLEERLYPAYTDGLKMQLAHSIVMQAAGYLRVQSHKYASAREKMQRQTERKRGITSTQLLSAGCGAYGFLNSTFYWNTKSLAKWGERVRRHEHPTWIGETLERDELMRKSMVLGVHTSSGIDRVAFTTKFRADPKEVFESEITEAVGLGLFTVDERAIRPTELGYFFGDELSVKFYSPRVRAVLDKLGMKYGMFFEQDRYA